MTCTVVCQVVSKTGDAAWYWTDALGRQHLDHVDVHPAASFADEQDPRIPINLGHRGDKLGEVQYLEEGLGFGGGDLYAVGVLEVDADLVDGLWCSPGLRAIMKDSIFAERSKINELAVVAATAGVTARPIRAFPGDFRNQYQRKGWGWNQPSILERAAAACPSYTERSAEWTLIHRPDPYAEQRSLPRVTGRPLPTVHRRVEQPYMNVDGQRLPIHYHGGGYVTAVR